jgi:hypothetical protein
MPFAPSCRIGAGVAASSIFLAAGDNLSIETGGSTLAV